MTQPDLLQRPEATPSWKEFRQEWLRPGLWNKNESVKQAQGAWGKLSPDKKIAAFKYAAQWQKDAVNSNSKDWNMLHCCRYISQERWGRYLETREASGPAVRIIKDTDPGYAAWLEHYRLNHENPEAYKLYIKGGLFHNKMRVPTEFPTEEKT